jgi:hypothetical protein
MYTAQSLAITVFSLWIPYALFVPVLRYIPRRLFPDHHWWILLPLKLLPVVSLVLTIWYALSPIVCRYDVSNCGLIEAAQESVMNPDIGGIGVVLGLFINCFAIAVVLMFGHVKSETSGMKELWVAQLYSKSR